eukprot:Lithocolla_globosa_v1_NODE_3898_length_1555_cov_7.318000.p3 type:complete len:122 gc:universal NODE_3898_length_1555_cov_7.318000:381-746(+)
MLNLTVLFFLESEGSVRGPQSSPVSRNRLNLVSVSIQLTGNVASGTLMFEIIMLVESLPYGWTFTNLKKRMRSIFLLMMKILLLWKNSRLHSSVHIARSSLLLYQRNLVPNSRKMKCRQIL